MDSNTQKILDTIRASNLATGFDTSKYNISSDFDIAEYKHALEVADVVMIRTSSGVADGTVYVDPLLEEQYAELEQHPHIVRKAYHYLSSHSSWTKQYDKFMEGVDGKVFDIFNLDFESAFNDRSKDFALSAFLFLTQLQNDFPDKIAELYTNKYIYQTWLQYYYNFDIFPYHHAQYPHNNWVNPESFSELLVILSNIFSGNTKPNLPDSRKPDNYDMWQIASNTGIGFELGYGADYLDVNVSRLPLEEYREWAGLYDRWSPEIVIPPEDDDGEIIVNPPLTELYYPCEEKWRITQYFGERPNVYYNSRGHNGVDFGTLVGSPIYCAADGVVEVAREDTNGYGRHLRIRHSHGMTIYGHLSKMLVGVGDVVKAKQIIGLSGGNVDDPYSGMSTGPHLHFEYRLDITAPQVPGGYTYNAIDPLPLLISHEDEEPIFMAKCLAGALNVRTGIGTSNSIVRTIKFGEIVNVYEEKDNWFRISGSLWCAGFPRYMEKINFNPPNPPEEPPVEPPSSQDKIVEVTVNTLNVRNDPIFSADTFVGHVYSGKKLNVIEYVDDDWCKITLYVSRKYIKEV